MKTVTLLVLAGGIAAAGYWYFNPQDRPGWVSDRLPVAPSASVQLYRWKNDQGEWTVSDSPPADGTPYEVVEYRHDENVMPAVEDNSG